MVDSVVSFVLKAFADWGRETITERLRSGGAFAQSVSNILEKESSKTKRRLKALTRKDLVESMNLFNEGFASNSLQSNDNEADAGPSRPKRGRMEHIPRLDEVKMCIVKNSFSQEAKKRFKDARKRAGSAIANEAMETEEVILATCIKVLSQMLETDDLATAFNYCLHYLRELHSREEVKINFEDEFKFIERRGKLFPPAIGYPGARNIIWHVWRLNRFVFDAARETGEAERSPKLFKTWPCVKIEQQIEIDPLRDPKLSAIFKLENRPFSIAPSLFDQNGAGERLRPQSPSERGEPITDPTNATPQYPAEVGRGNMSALRLKGTKRKLYATYV